MKKIIRKNIALGIFIAILLDTVIGYLLFKSRPFSHLAIWNIIESGKQEDFYWYPNNAPEYFRFGKDEKTTAIFKDEIVPLVESENDELKRMLTVARHVMDVSSSKPLPVYLPLKWDSPERMLRQIKKGAIANCFHRAVLFSTYLSGLGIKSRLWALENDNFKGTAHTINEVYIDRFKRWVFIDIMHGFYVAENGKTLSFLELREKLLNDSGNAVLCNNISDKMQKEVPDFYRQLVKDVFLRTNNDFAGKYNNRYGILSIFNKYIDKFPDSIRRGLDYLLGGQDIFIHYIDKDSKSLRPAIIIAKLFFYFFILSLSIIFILLVSLSKKDTRHR